MAQSIFKRKNKRETNAKIMVFFMAFIMIGSVFGVIFFGYNQQENKVKYNKVEFIQKEDLWSARINSKEAVFNYLPTDVEDIEIEDDVSNRLASLVEIDPTSEINNSFKEYIALAQHQMILTLNNFNIYVRSGFTAENEFNMPIITCKDSTSEVPVVYFIESNQTKIYLENNCIIAEGNDGFDFLRIKDRLLYSLLGILE